MDLLVMLFKFHAELIFSLMNMINGLFTKKELKDVSGEMVFITGAGHGIGRELALKYADQGSEVICVDINEDANKETVALANKLKKGRAFGYVCDVTDRDAVLATANKIRAEVGHVSVIVNNAGIMPCHPLDKTTHQEIRKMFEVNTLAHFWIYEAFLPHMKEKNRGHLISISSIAGLIGSSNVVPYSATKFAVRGMMEALYEELREEKSNVSHGKTRDLIMKLLPNLTFFPAIYLQIGMTVIFPYMVDTGLCKNPQIKYKSLMKLVSPKDVAEEIITAHREGEVNITIPRYMNFTNQFFRNFPTKCQIIAKDFFGSGLGSDLHSKH